MNLFTSALFRLSLVGALAAPAAAGATKPTPAPIPAGRDLVRSLMVQANTSLAEGRYVDVEKKLNAVLKVEPKHAGAELLFGRSREAQKDLPGAMTHYQRYLKLAPPTEPGYAAVREKVKGYERQPGHPAVAVSGRDLDPISYAFEARKEAEALQEKSPELALEKLDEALRLNEADSVAFRLRARILQKLHRQAEADADLKRADIINGR